MPTQRHSSTASCLVRTAFIAGVATAGAAFWMAATTAPDVTSAAPQVQLASIGSPMLSPAPTDCPTLLCSNLIGSRASSPTPGPLFAALIGPSATPSIASTPGMNPISALISVFVSDGTADHPNAGLLIGNGYQGTDGQNGGLLFGGGGKGGAAGSGGAGANGGSAGNGGSIGPNNGISRDGGVGTKGNVGAGGTGGQGGAAGTAGTGGAGSTSGHPGASGTAGGQGTTGSAGGNGHNADG